MIVISFVFVVRQAILMCKGRLELDSSGFGVVWAGWEVSLLNTPSQLAASAKQVSLHSFVQGRIRVPVVPFVVSQLCMVTNSGVLHRWSSMAVWLRRNLCQRGQWTRQRRLFCLKGDPNALSTRAHSTAQTPTPGRKQGHFVHVRINASKTIATSETGAQALRTQCINGPFQNHSPLWNRGAKHCVRNAKKELDRGPLTTPKPTLTVYCPSETTAPSETRG